MKSRKVLVRRRSFVPTLFGVRTALFYGVVVGAYFASPYINLFFLLLGFISLQVAVTLPSAIYNLRGVEARGEKVEASMPTGTSARFPATLEKRRGTAFDVSLEMVLAKNGSTQDLGSYVLTSGRANVLRGKREVDIQFPELARGVWSSTDARLTSTYPFGLLRRSKPVALEAEVVVYPAPLEAGIDTGRSARELMNDLASGSLQSDGALQPAALRDHREGESFRSVHWKASARRDRFIVQEWDGGASDSLEVVLDRRTDRDALEFGLQELAAIVCIARDGKEVLRIRSQGIDRAFGEGHGRWSEALRFLAEAEALSSNEAPPPASSPGVLRLPRNVTSTASSHPENEGLRAVS